MGASAASGQWWFSVGRAVCAVLLLAVLGVVPVAAQSNDGTVTGTVVNKTAGGAATGGTDVVLVSFGRKEQAPVGQLTVQAAADGRFAFTGVNRDPNLVYILLARFQNVNYPTDQPFQLQDQPNQQADITVYDATTADDAIKLERLNLLVVGADQGVVQFMEMGSVVNSGDRTFVTANPQDQQLARALKFALPQGALGVQMQTGFDDRDVIPGVGGVQVTTPVPPGSHQFAFSFQLPYSGSNADVSMQMPYPTGTYSVYLPDTGIKLDASGLTPGGPAQLGGQSYALYSANNLSKATMVGGQLSGLGSTGIPGTNQVALISLGVVLFVLGGGVLLFGARLRPAAVAADGPPRGPDSEQERLELVVRLAALDERFAAGELGQAEYDAERERGKQRLRELTLARRHTLPTGV
ncbi:MAG TPA: SHOCT domain-containing protein [Chloroflexota bacterium]|nr:SHOCT domain-containing protein [Chloroflexota bacterium]